MAEVGRRQRKKTELRVSGGIAGLIALSGAVAAAAALVSVFRNRSKRRPNNDLASNLSIAPLEQVNHCNKKEEDGEGLRSLLQTTPLCEEIPEREEDALRICSTPISSRPQENETDLGLKSKEEAQAFDDCGPVVDNLKDSLPQADAHDVMESGICVAFEDMGALENGNSNVADNEEDRSSQQPAQTIAVTEESFENSEEAMIPQMEELDEEVDGDVNFEEKEEDDDVEEEEDEEEVAEFSDEKEGESSDGTGDSSVESSAEAVWPTESFEVRGTKICGDVSTKADKEEAETGLEGEFAAKTKKKYEQNGSFGSIKSTKVSMEKGKGACALVILMEKAVPKSSISRLLLIFVMVGLALHLLGSSATSYDLQDSSR